MSTTIFFSKPEGYKLASLQEMKKYFFTGYFASQFQNLRCEIFVDRTFVVATGVSNLFFFAYLLFILLEKIFLILILKLLNKSMILSKFFTFFKYVSHSKPRWGTFQ